MQKTVLSRAFPAVSDVPGAEEAVRFLTEAFGPGWGLTCIDPPTVTPDGISASLVFFQVGRGASAWVVIDDVAGDPKVIECRWKRDW